ncbi:hypothetical protein ACFFJY_10530 [Fictibacillus aquaticus]|uniref:Uncharacterized protein n=1 Tax=Fictibacillus aquaticus TaxID=2021314 RepID=A0A235FBI6_9BACL|nr:hypothetical protein [Fictibacillus aquaticus]OYD58691.1 hypothetical protein CGZ90_01975 [Fictibacillus aquaticus]
MQHIDTSADKKENGLTKVQAIDAYLDSLNHVTSVHIAKILYNILKIDINRISSAGEGRKASLYPPAVMERVRSSLERSGKPVHDAFIMNLEKAEVLDHYLGQHHNSGSGIRAAINMIFGMNIEGIATLAAARIALYSKGQWISKTNKDLVAVYTGKGDIDVEIRPTPYFTEKTGLTNLPENLQELLQNLGFSFHEEKGAYYYCNPEGESVPDDFKTKTMNTIMNGMSGYASL